ncbi:MAG: NUDIX hydrolase [Caldilineaceae bacterium]|nr:NUDIX hydrolase [Caldilineaceae bacterium]
MDEQRSPQPWTNLGSEAGPLLPLGMQVRYDRLRNPRNGVERKALVIETGDWVNVVAITADERIVVVRQYRFGIAQISTEIPGGLVDPGEDHRVAAVRELMEETGYTSDDWHYLGAVDTNPAFLTNRCQQWLARNVVQTSPPHFEEGEDIVVAALTPAELGAEINAGAFRHSLAMLALAHVYDLKQLRGGDR